MNSNRLFEVLAKVDENHFVIVENDCVEIYNKQEFYATPMPRASCVEDDPYKTFSEFAKESY